MNEQLVPVQTGRAAAHFVIHDVNVQRIGRKAIVYTVVSGRESLIARRVLSIVCAGADKQLDLRTVVCVEDEDEHSDV